MRVAFDSRPAKDVRGIGRYSRCLLDALRDSGRGEIVETHDPRRCDVYHAPSIDGAMLRSPVPMVVTVHDMVPLKRRGEYLRSGLRFKLRYLAVERAVRVIVPTSTVAHDVVESLHIASDQVAVIPEAADPTFYPRPKAAVRRAPEPFTVPERSLLGVGGLRSPAPPQRVAELAPGRPALPL